MYSKNQKIQEMQRELFKVSGLGTFITLNYPWCRNSMTSATIPCLQDVIFLY